MDQLEKSGSHSFGRATVRVYATIDALGKAAASEAAAIIRSAIAQKGKARIIIATGNSQLALIDALTSRTDVDWKSVEVFHMDEYIGLSPDHPSSFRYWLRTRVENRVHPLKMHYLAGDAADIDREIKRYSDLLTSAPIDLAFVGFGENGHIAFNDPPVADFADPAIVKRVLLDDMCRQQQAGEGHFPDFDSVPKEAVTITCPGLFRAEAWVCSVPEKRKAEAVRNALQGPISTACPASIVRTHPRALVYLDTESAGLLDVPELV
jgi:glucosamine-6-phosphate deaminase